MTMRNSVIVIVVTATVVTNLFNLKEKAILIKAMSEVRVFHTQCIILVKLFGI